MIVEIAGVSSRNKGAELMLLAVMQHYANSQPELQYAVEPNYGPFEDRAARSLRTLLINRRWGRSTLAAKLMPAGLRRTCGIATLSDIGAVIDASGFAFSDQLGVRRVEEFARDVRRWKSNGLKVVMLPQALGPFQNPAIRSAFYEVIKQVDLIYARDRTSWEHLVDIGGKSANLRQAPDFTNLVEGVLPNKYVPQPKTALIVPNHRMVEKTEPREGAAYVPFLASCIDALAASGFKPTILLHDSHVDEGLVRPLQTACAVSIDVVREKDPIFLKGILGSAQIVVGSRFHALVGSLSQAVPCIGAGWSHKYQMLFEDYGCQDMLLQTTAPAQEIVDRVRRATEDESRRHLVSTLRESSLLQKQRVHAMWQEIDSLFGIKQQARDVPSREAAGGNHTGAATALLGCG